MKIIVEIKKKSFLTGGKLGLWNFHFSVWPFYASRAGLSAYSTIIQNNKNNLRSAFFNVRNGQTNCFNFIASKGTYSCDTSLAESSSYNLYFLLFYTNLGVQLERRHREMFRTELRPHSEHWYHWWEWRSSDFQFRQFTISPLQCLIKFSTQKMDAMTLKLR